MTVANCVMCVSIFNFYIFRAVILFFAVYMVDLLAFLEASSNLLLGDKSMLVGVAANVR